MKDKRMAFIVVWFGDFPRYLNLFLHSALKQKDFDFIFFAENELPVEGANIFLNKISFKQFNSLAIERGVIETPLGYPYKLCDIKPAWTHILQDFLPESKYDYVGYIDIDLILGNVNDFFPPILIRKYDLCSITTEYLSGAFTIYRNNLIMRTMYKNARGWKYILNSSHHFAFDETLRFNGLSEKEIAEIGTEYGNLQSFSDVIFEAFKKGEISINADKYIAFESLPKLIRYDDGIISDVESGIQYIMFHFVGAKQNPFWVYPDWELLPPSFYVNKYGFFIFRNSPLTIKDLIRGGYFKQICRNFQKKANTFKRLLANFKFKSILTILVKYTK